MFVMLLEAAGMDKCLSFPFLNLYVALFLGLLTSGLGSHLVFLLSLLSLTLTHDRRLHLHKNNHFSLLVLDQLRSIHIVTVAYTTSSAIT